MAGKKIALAALLALLASSAQAEGILDTIVSNAQAASSGWMNTALGYAQNLFFGLAAIEFVWAATQLVLQKGELSEMMVGLLQKILAISFFSMVLTMAPTWVPAIYESLKQAGQNIGGAPNLSPSHVMDLGIGVSAQLVEKGMALNGGLIEAAFDDGLGKWMLSAVVIGLSGIIVIIGYTVVAIQMAITLVEMYVVIGGGALMLGFLGSRWTMSWGERFFGYAVSIGVKLMTLYLIVGFGESLTNAIMQHLENLANSNGGHLGMTDFLAAGGASLAYGAIGYLVPGVAGSMLNGSPSLSMSNVGQAGKGIASMPVNAALSTGAAAMRGAGLAAGSVGMLMSKFGGLAKGAISGVSSGAGGAGGSITGNFTGQAGGAQAAKGLGQNGTQTQKNQGQGGSQAQKNQGQGGAQAAKGLGQNGTQTQKNQGQGGSQGQSTAGAPGFQNPSNSPSPRSMDSNQSYANTGNAGNVPGGAGGGNANRMTKLAQKLNSLARDTQYAAYRHNTSMGHDGNTGSAPSIRLNI